MGILFPAEDFGAKAQNDIIVIFEELTSFINLYGCHRLGLFALKNVFILHLSILLNILLGENSFKLL